MKYKYLKIAGDFIYGKNTLERRDLIDVVERRIDVIINIEDGKQFDPKLNSWEDITGE